MLALFAQLTDGVLGNAVGGVIVAAVLVAFKIIDHQRNNKGGSRHANYGPQDRERDEETSRGVKRSYREPDRERDDEVAHKVSVGYREADRQRDQAMVAVLERIVAVLNIIEVRTKNLSG